MLELVALREIGSEAVDALLDRAFGPDRRVRTAYRIRAGAVADPTLSFAALEFGVLVGTIQCWPVALWCDDGVAIPLTMVGPVAVAPTRQNSGIGRVLMHRSLDAAKRDGAAEALMLIGDPGYYGQFGFSAERTGAWRVPGPVERHRLLARGPDVPDAAGMLGTRARLAA